MSTAPLNTTARAVADVTRGMILASVEIAAPIERTFEALTSDEITQWWGSPEMYRTTEYAADLRPGGKWKASGVGADGHAFSVEGEFKVIEAPHKIVQTWRAAWDGDHETVITYRLESIEGGTRVTLSHEGFADRTESCRGHASGWERVLGWLVGHFAKEPRYYLCRLLPPRPSFALDMNAEEKAMMGEHAAYWRSMLEAIRDANPAIKAGKGLRYEVLPMMRAVH